MKVSVHNNILINKHTVVINMQKLYNCPILSLALKEDLSVNMCFEKQFTFVLASSYNIQGLKWLKNRVLVSLHDLQKTFTHVRRKHASALCHTRERLMPE